MKLTGRLFQVEGRARTDVHHMEINMMCEDRKGVYVVGVLSQGSPASKI